MRTFDEGRLRFAFPAAWPVLKYDDCAFYRGPVQRSGAELAAVDFVVAPATTSASLTLLEVKDFRKHAVANRARLGAGALAVEIMQKALHSLAALFVGAHCNAAEVRPLAATLNAPTLALRVVLLLEEDPQPVASAGGHLSTRAKFALNNSNTRRGDLLRELQSKCKPLGMVVHLYRCADVPAREGWTATAL